MDNIIVEERKGTDLCSINLYLPIGLADENEDVLGISHLIEHLLFHGHSDFDQSNFCTLFEEFGGVINAESSMDYTGIYCRIGKEYVDSSIELMLNAISNFNINHQVIEREKLIIKKESEMIKKRFNHRLQSSIFSHLYNGHAYARDIGTTASYDNMKQDRIVDYYKKNYKLDYWSLVVVGDVCESKIRERWTWDRAVRTKTYSQPKSMNHNIEINNEEVLPYSALNWNITEGANFDILAKLTYKALADGLSSPLYKAIVQEKGLAYNLVSTDINHLYDANAFIGFEYKKERKDEVLNLINEIVYKIDNEKILSKADIQRSINRTSTEYYLRNENGGRAARHYSINLALKNKKTSLIDELRFIKERDLEEWEMYINNMIKSQRMILK